MSDGPDSVANRFDRIRLRLEQITALLRDGQTGDGEAAELAAEAAALIEEASKKAADAAEQLNRD
ncbi:MAG: hypothetical protein M9938_10175 [Solirubrobacterales bacterium]|nr:hypothetical protein [Solirubrobacterales bacterium]